jgi:hypothetical protein
VDPPVATVSEVAVDDYTASLGDPCLCADTVLLQGYAVVYGCVYDSGDQYMVSDCEASVQQAGLSAVDTESVVYIDSSQGDISAVLRNLDQHSVYTISVLVATVLSDLDEACRAGGHKADFGCLGGAFAFNILRAQPKMDVRLAHVEDTLLEKKRAQQGVRQGLVRQFAVDNSSESLHLAPSAIGVSNIISVAAPFHHYSRDLHH